MTSGWFAGVLEPGALAPGSPAPGPGGGGAGASCAAFVSPSFCAPVLAPRLTRSKKRPTPSGMPFTVSTGFVTSCLTWPPNSVAEALSPSMNASLFEMASSCRSPDTSLRRISSIPGPRAVNTP